jgi:hypothetical protein
MTKKRGKLPMKNFKKIEIKEDNNSNKMEYILFDNEKKISLNKITHLVLLKNKNIKDTDYTYNSEFIVSLKIPDAHEVKALKFQLESIIDVLDYSEKNNVPITQAIENFNK